MKDKTNWTGWGLKLGLTIILTVLTIIVLADFFPTYKEKSDITKFLSIFLLCFFWNSLIPKP